MDTESSTTSDTRGEDNPRQIHPTGGALSRVISAPDPLRPGYRQNEGLKSPSIVRKFQLARESDDFSTQWPQPTTTQPDAYAERPEKRPRLDHKLDTRFGKSIRRGIPLDVSAGIYDRYRHAFD
jgi:hypothetical protein